MNKRFGCRTIARSIIGSLNRAVYLAAAEIYPGKPIRMMLAYRAGSSINLAGRRPTEDLAVELGQPIIGDNRPGANGIIGSQAVARTTPDGYTIPFTTMPAHAGNH